MSHQKFLFISNVDDPAAPTVAELETHSPGTRWQRPFLNSCIDVTREVLESESFPTWMLVNRDELEVTPDG